MQLRVIQRIELDMSYASALIHAFIFSELDYCESLFAGFPSARLDKFQMVLRLAARVSDGIKSVVVTGRTTNCKPYKISKFCS